MVRLNQRGLDCGNQTILGEKLVREPDGGGDNTIQGLLCFDLDFGYVDVKNRWNKKLLGRLYSSF